MAWFFGGVTPNQFQAAQAAGLCPDTIAAPSEWTCPTHGYRLIDGWCSSCDLEEHGELA
jgi:hypothetical protein